MEVQGEDAGRTWLDWWRPKQEAGDEVDPASQQKTENTDGTVPEDGALGLRKLNGKYVGGTMPLLAVISLILLSGVIFRLSTKRDSPILSPPELRSPQLSSPELSSPQLNPPELSSPTSSSPTASSPTSSSPTLSSNNEWTPLPVSDDTIRRYMDDLKDAEVTMNKAWGSLGQSLKEDFQKHFMPSSKDGQTPTENPLAVITEHVVKMQKCEFPSDSSAKVQNDFLQHVRLLVTICRMATLRLDELDWLLPWKTETEAPVDFPDNEEADSNSGLGSNSENSSLVGPGELLRMQGLFGIEWKQEGVHAKAASRLSHLFVLREKRNVSNLEAQYYFERFLQRPNGDDTFNVTRSTVEHEIPYTGKPFRTGALAQAAAQLFPCSEGTTYYPKIEKMHRIAENWTHKEVLRVMKQQKEESANNLKKRLQMKRQNMHEMLKKGIQNNDLEIIALFLL